MMKFKVLLVLSVLLASSFSTINLAGAIESPSVNVYVDNLFYRTGDIIRVYGQVGGTLEPDDEPVVKVEIISPNGDVTFTKTVEVSWSIGSRDFGFQHTIAGPLDQDKGQYRVVATYEKDGQTVTGETTFDYIALESDPDGWLSFTAQAGDKTYDIKYKLPNLVLKKVEFDNSTTTMLIVFEPGPDGRESILDLRFPDELFPFEITEVVHEVRPRSFNASNSNNETTLTVGVWAFNEPSEIRVFGTASGETGVVADATNDATGQSLYEGGRTFYGEQFSEEASANSSVVDCATVKMRRHGSPTGTAEVGFYDTNMTLLRQFGTMDVGNLTTGYKAYEFCLPSSERGHLILENHILAVKYDEGDPINRIDVRRSNTGAGPDYDGLASYHVYHDGNWHIFGYAGYSRDLLFELTNTKGELINDDLKESNLELNDNQQILTVNLDKDQQHPILPIGLTTNSGTGELIVADSTGHSIFIVNTTTREVSTRITLAERNETFSFDGPDVVVASSTYLYVPNAPYGKISVLDIDGYELVDSIDVGESLWWATYDPENQEVYFVSKTSKSIFVISDITHDVVSEIAVGQLPLGIAYNPSDGLVYVAILGDTAGENAGIQVINTTNHEVVEMIPIDQHGPRFIAFDSVNQRMYVTCGSGDVVVIDSNTHEIIKSIFIPDTPLGYYVEADTGKHFVYSNFTQVLNSSPDRVASNPSEIIIVPDNYGYVVHAYGVGVLSVIDLETMSVIGQIPTLPVSYGITYNPSDGKIYLSHEYLNSVSAIPLVQMPT
jgi:YVTN family beta-propeller protein